MFCELYRRLRAEIKQKCEVWESEVGLITAKAGHVDEREAAEAGRVDSLETTIVTMETKVEDRGTFQSARKAYQPRVGAQVREVPTQNRFTVLRDEVKDDPIITLVDILL